MFCINENHAMIKGGYLLKKYIVTMCLQVWRNKMFQMEVGEAVYFI